MRKVSRAHTRKIETAIKKAELVKTYNSDNSWSGEYIEVDEKLANSVIEDIMLCHATLYDKGNGKFRLEYTPNCYWELSL